MITAVQYLENWLKDNLIIIGVDFDQALIKAKQMEKQEIIEAHGVKQKTKSNPGSIVTYGYNYTGEMYFHDNYEDFGVDLEAKEHDYQTAQPR
jgi:hypothetical protein